MCSEWVKETSAVTLVQHFFFRSDWGYFCKLQILANQGFCFAGLFFEAVLNTHTHTHTAIHFFGTYITRSLQPLNDNNQMGLHEIRLTQLERVIHGQGKNSLTINLNRWRSKLIPCPNQEDIPSTKSDTAPKLVTTDNEQPTLVQDITYHPKYQEWGVSGQHERGPCFAGKQATATERHVCMCTHTHIHTHTWDKHTQPLSR